MNTARLTRKAMETLSTAVGLTEKSRPMVGRATLTMVVSMMDMNMAATKTTLTATFSLPSPVVPALPDSGGPVRSACVFMMSFPERGERAGPGHPAGRGGGAQGALARRREPDR